MWWNLKIYQNTVKITGISIKLTISQNDATKKGGQLKYAIIIKGGTKIMTYNDQGEGEGKIAQKSSDVINGWPLFTIINL